MRKVSKVRLANGAVAALIVVFFLVHGLLGGFSLLSGEQNSVPILVWCALAFIAVHVVLSIFTSREQLNDPDHPASPRKKRHLAFKWISGIALGLLAAVHVVATQTDQFGAIASVSGILLLSALACVLALHIAIGAKSLLKDINLDRRYKRAFQILVWLIAGVIVIVLLIVLLK